MATASSGQESAQNSGRWAGLMLAGVILAIGLPLLYWLAPSADQPHEVNQPSQRIRQLPPPPEHPTFPIPLHHVSIEDLGNGRPTLKLIAKENGDVMVLDATTGRLLEVRDSKGKPTWVPIPKLMEVNPQFSPHG